MALKDPLRKYHEKRDFGRTSEPAGREQQTGAPGHLFIVQKHEARRLHWDLRLEIDGVLASWAVTRGPSADPEVKRLAVRAEDHPLDYAQFEGTIPQGEYGGGTVMVWDTGNWEPVEGKSAADLQKGHLHFRLTGRRMKGEWLLIRLAPRKGEKRENWLLRKIADEFAEEGDGLVERNLTSVLTERSMVEIARGASGKPLQEGRTREASRSAPRGRSRRNQAPPPFEQPQLATLVNEVPAGNAWMHEIKFDGYRALVAAAGKQVRVHTRNGKDWTDKFAPLAREIGKLDLPPCLIDGEIVGLGSDSSPSFSVLQGLLKRGHGAQGEADQLSFHAFDLLYLDGEDLKPLANIERKERLEALLADARPPIHIADHIIGAGEKLLEAMCRAGQEGIISKSINAPYVNRRAKNWLKVKCIQRQSFVIVGWTPSDARMRPFAALLLAQEVDGKLTYRGKVGTGFDEKTLEDLGRRLAALATDKPSVPVPAADARKARWVRPRLVAEVAFVELTNEGRVRHGSFLGLQAGKPATGGGNPRAVPATPEKASSGIAVSNRDRIIFPESGLTKGDLADYYEAIGPTMLPFTADRPLSLVRCPQGRSSKCFFQKHDSGTFGPHVHHVPIVEKSGAAEEYLYVDSLEGILACVQMGTIEFHGWCSRASSVELPDRMVFDLDPDEALDFAEVKDAAVELRRQLDRMGLVSFALLSGGKGAHVVVPLSPGHSWEDHKDFSRRFAEAMSEAYPDRFVATISKAKRKGRIFIDWLRNQRGSTSISPYSARARPGAPVAVPVGWAELEEMKDASPFSIADAAMLNERSISKPLRGWGIAAQSLPGI